MNYKIHHFKTLLAGTLLLLWCLPAMSQDSKGSISGTVIDLTNAVVPGAQIKATNIETGSVFKTTSDSFGFFRLSLLPTGTYTIEITEDGFKTVQYKEVTVSAGHDNFLGSLRLSASRSSEIVEFEEPPLVQTQSEVSTTVSPATLNSFAGIQEREGLDILALFVPGIISARSNNFSNTNGGSGLSNNGLRGRNNDQQIDGQNNDDNSVAGPSLALSDPNFVQQYTTVTGNLGPEYGRNGSVVNVVTRSGSNEWHGSVYGSENNSYLNALGNQQKHSNDLNGKPLTGPPRSNDEFGGGTIGGPVLKNKLFLFNGFDQEIVSGNSVYTAGAITPTPLGLSQLAGCAGVDANALAALNKAGPYSFSTGNPTPLPFPGGQFVNLFINFNCPSVQFGGVARTVPTPEHAFNWLERGDLQLGHDTIAGRYLFNRDNLFNQNLGGNGAGGWVSNVTAFNQAVLLSWTHFISSHQVNEARVSFGRENVEFGGNTIGNTFLPSADKLGSALANVSFNFGGLLGFGPSTNLPQGRVVNTWQAQDNWRYVAGKHQFKAGATYTFQRSPNTFLPNFNGQYRFTNWTSFFANVPNRIVLAQGSPFLDFREHDVFLYAGDDWKLTQNLTLSLSLSWSKFSQPINLLHQITTNRESNPAVALWNPTLPLSIRTNPLISSVNDSFGPSVGFAYAPQWGGFLTGGGKTIVRGGYRLLYDPNFYNVYLNVATSAPAEFLQTLVGTMAFANSLPALPTGTNVRAQLASSVTPGVFDPRSFSQTIVSPDLKPDRVHTWSLGIQREITKHAVFEARYVGTHGDRLLQSVNGNPFIAALKQSFPSLVPAGLTPCPAANAQSPQAIGRVNCNQGVVRLRDNSGFSDYDGLQTEFRASNLFDQLTVRAGYTFSKALDNTSEIFSTFSAGNTQTFAQNPLQTGGAERSVSGLSVPHAFTLMFHEQLPFFKKQQGFAGHLLGGWSLSGNYILASGQPYTPSQRFEAFLGSGNFYDLTFVANFQGADIARPFFGNPAAPATSVGIFAGDSCNLFGVGCSQPAKQLINASAINGQPVVALTRNDVRFIINSSTAQTVFGTPFGDVPRNSLRDAIQNVANFSISKRIKLGERAAFELHATALNVFNHYNFSSIDPFIDDAGLTGFNLGFANPAVTDAPGRKVFVGAKITF
jgi:hypothetical protein